MLQTLGNCLGLSIVILLTPREDYSGLLEWKAAQLGTHVVPVSQLEVEVLGGGAPTLLRTSEFLFVETRLV